ncbi:MAG: hypoxanthine phosphoribosyltransferase [Oscillospiraceae bacterium]|nr:hypoxanthine phosphoribosyltransferase [Oscillospiraceae bacterium]
MLNDIEKILFSEEDIQRAVDRLGAAITEEYRDKFPVMIGVLKGCFVFMSDLVRRVQVPCQIDFMSVSSYVGTSSTGAVKITKDLSQDIEGRHIIIVEDILDSGVTLHYLLDVLSVRKPASVKICTLLDKPARRKVELRSDYCGFECPDEFIVGSGLDYNEKYRNLPFIGVLRPELYGA